MKAVSSFTISPDERSERRKQLRASLADKEYRDEFVRQQIETGLPFQIKGMRKARDWNQDELGKRLGKPQSVVSRLESSDYGKFTLQTLLQLASVFDVALLVTFVPFSHLADRALSYSIRDVEIPEFSKDPGFITTGSGEVAYLRPEGTGVENMLVSAETTPAISEMIEQPSLPWPQWQKAAHT